MLCPLCRKRKARRACPALNQAICAVCCGTKRLVEIACEPDCGYLQSARAHPAAPLQRQRERDARCFLGLTDGFSRTQMGFLLLFHRLLGQYRHDPLHRLSDRDVAEAAASLAATLETAARGIIYEHPVASAPAQRLVTDFKLVLGQLTKQGTTVRERELAAVLRRVEQFARNATQHLDPGPRAYIDFAERLGDPSGTAGPMDAPAGAEAEPRSEDAPRIVLP